jgi:hypothetical protein
LDWFPEQSDWSGLDEAARAKIIAVLLQKLMAILYSLNHR